MRIEAHYGCPSPVGRWGESPVRACYVRESVEGKPYRWVRIGYICIGCWVLQKHSHFRYGDLTPKKDT